MSRGGAAPVSFRLPPELVERIDAQVAAWRGALPGVTLTRTDLVVVLLEAGLKSPSAAPPAARAGP